jgi:hypothetical protein
MREARAYRRFAAIGCPSVAYYVTYSTRGKETAWHWLKPLRNVAR